MMGIVASVFNCSMSAPWTSSLWPPCAADADIRFCPVVSYSFFNFSFLA